MDFFAQYFAIFQQGGPMMYLLFLCSFIVVAIGVERFMYYKENRTDLDCFLTLLTPALERCEWDDAIAICRQTSGGVAMVALKGIQCLQRDVCHIDSVLEGESSLVVARLRENLNHLDLIITLAPLLGLLGTIMGMITSFNLMNVKASQPLAITGGVGEALVATATGLCVAILAMLVYSYFNHRLDRIITDIETVCNLLIEQIKREKSHEIA